MSGDIRVNGFPKEQKTFARVTGYVEQSDIHSPQVRMQPRYSPCRQHLSWHLPATPWCCMLSSTSRFLSRVLQAAPGP